MFKITEKQAKGVEYTIGMMYENAAEKITMANKELNKDFEYAYSSGLADERCKQEIIQKICYKFNDKASKSNSLVNAVVDFLNDLFKLYFNWYPASSTSVSTNRHKELQRDALASIIEIIGNICPLIKSGMQIKPLFE